MRHMTVSQTESILVSFFFFGDICKTSIVVQTTRRGLNMVLKRDGVHIKVLLHPVIPWMGWFYIAAADDPICGRQRKVQTITFITRTHGALGRHVVHSISQKRTVLQEEHRRACEAGT